MLFLDTCTSHSQLVGTLAPGRISAVADPLIDFNLEVDRLGDHVLHSAILAHSMLNEVGLPAFCNINTEKRKEMSMNKGRHTWNSAFIQLLIAALIFKRSVQIQDVIFLTAQLQFS